MRSKNEKHKSGTNELRATNLDLYGYLGKELAEDDQNFFVTMLRPGSV